MPGIKELFIFITQSFENKEGNKRFSLSIISFFSKFKELTQNLNPYKRASNN